MSETATPLSDWDQIWAQQADETLIRTVVTRSATEIESFLVSDEETEEETLALIGRRLSGVIDPGTYDVLLEAMRALLGLDGASVIHWYTVGGGAATGIIEEVASARVSFFLRRIAAAYLPELQDAFAMWKETPEDWRGVHREVFFDSINQRYVLHHRIQKVNGEEILLEGNANSVLDLTRSLLTSLRLVGVREAFDEPPIAAFLEEADAVIGFLRPEQLSAENDGAGDLAE